MDLENIEKFIEQVCERIGQKYAGFHTISAGKLEGEGCPDVYFHVIDGHGYRMLVGSTKTVVKDGGVEVATFTDLTKSEFFTPNDESGQDEDAE